MSLNSSSAKYSQWLARVVHGRIIPYTFQSRGETINATKFEVTLVGKKPDEYVQGLVRFDFKNKEKPQKAAAKFEDMTVWKVRKPSIQSGKSQWNGAPNKNIVVLDHPSEFQPVLASTAEAKIPSEYVSPPMRLKEVLAMTEHGSLSVDIALVATKVEPTRTESVRGTPTKVRSLTVRDETAEANVSVWGKATSFFDGKEGKAFLAFGIGVSVNPPEVSMSVRESTAIFFSPTSPRLEELQALKNDTTLQRVTSRATGKQLVCEGEVRLACCAFLDNWEGDNDVDMPYQLMGALLNPSTSEVLTQDGARLFQPISLHDPTGSASAALIETPVLQFYGLESKESVVQKAAANELETASCRWNVRGVRRKGEFFVTELLASPWEQTPSAEGRKLTEVAAQCGPFRDGAFAAPASGIVTHGFANLAIETAAKSILRPHRVLLLIQGTQKSTLEKASADPDARVVCSENVKCLLSSENTKVNIRGYAKEMDLLDFKLDKDSAVVTVSNVLKSENSKTWLVIETLSKISADKVTPVAKALLAEFEMAAAPRGALDKKRAAELCEPARIKRAKSIAAYPSDPQ